ncbi:Ig-like domain-containing protein [Sanguibacter sp. 4.1]|uniref:Ig-like domain-containing protein n=1 Tax=Sanguibacter biliveldensis TaxID=3030830 RepID=A0AAF1C347_9MICO|nr:Ig-like domain-containing protein [Sanguibacter sp. 4.1]WPF82745.1 Ig-like domain-containing protein [Sanguibacter sp. 4.1]
MRTRRTPAPHTSRPRATRLSRLVAALLAAPLALGTLAATALPAAAVPATPSITLTGSEVVVGKEYRAEIVCPENVDFPLLSAAWEASDESGGPAYESGSDGSQRYYDASVTFATPGTHGLVAVCRYSDIDDVRSQPQQVVVASDVPEVRETTTGLNVFSSVVEPGEKIDAQAVVFSESTPVTGGSVTFSLDGTPIVPASLVVDGTASALIDAAPGHHELMATYSGSKDLNLKESVSLVQDVRVRWKSDVLAPVPPLVTGSEVTLTAQVVQAPELSTPRGTITFTYDGGKPLGTATELDGGAVSLVVSGLVPGVYRDVIATYSGDKSYSKGVSEGMQMVVEAPRPAAKAPTTVTVDVPKTSSPRVEITVTVERAQLPTFAGVAEVVHPTGTVLVRLGTKGMQKEAALVDGVATVVFDGTQPGDYTVDASYSGDERFKESFGISSTTVGAPPVTPVTPKVTVPATVTTTVGTPATFTVGLPAENRPATLRITGAREPVDILVPAAGDVTVTVPVLDLGTHEIVVETAATKTLDATAHTVRIVVAGEPARGSSTPDADLTGSTTTLVTGKKITLVARDFEPFETVAFFLHSDPVFLGTAVADENGVATLVVALPAGVPAGAHHVQATGGTSGRWAEISVTVTEGTPAAEAPVATGPIVTVPIAAPVAPAAPAPVVAAPAAPAAVTATPLAATGAELGSSALLVSVLLGSGALLIAGRRRFTTSAR